MSEGMDMISTLHVEGVSTRHHIPYSHVMSWNHMYVEAEASKVAKLLEVEAPADEYSIYVAEDSGPKFRSFSRSDHPKRWIALTAVELDGTVQAPFPVKRVELSSGYTVSAIRSLSYIPRTYLGLNGKYLVGFDLEFDLKGGLRECELYESGGKLLLAKPPFAVDDSPTVGIRVVKPS